MKHTAMTILYELHDNLYINLTNRCPCSCTFCLRQNREDMGTSDSLWLEHEPSFEEVAAEFENFDMDRYHEIVFCGFGEPTEALDVLLKTAPFHQSEYTGSAKILPARTPQVRRNLSQCYAGICTEQQKVCSKCCADHCFHYSHFGRRGAVPQDLPGSWRNLSHPSLRKLVH